MKVGFYHAGYGAPGQCTQKLMESLNELGIETTSIASSKEDVDLVHFTGLVESFKKLYLLFKYRSTPKVATIHGGTLYYRPDLHPSGKLIREKSLLSNRLFKNQFDRIVAVSRNLKHRVEEKLDTEVDVIYNGVDDDFRVIRGAKNYVHKKYGFKDYLLHVSAKSVRKNIGALNYLKKRYNLITIGKGWNSGYVNQEDLVYLYNASKVFVFPSIHEEFGLPNVEAMACGTPVVTSNAYAIPEVVGDSAIKCNP